MNEAKLYELIISAQAGDSRAIELIIKKMTPKIRKSLYSIDLRNREDLEQEIKLKLIEAIYNYEVKAIPGFWEFVELNHRRIIQATTH